MHGKMNILRIRSAPIALLEGYSLDHLTISSPTKRVFNSRRISIVLFTSQMLQVKGFFFDTFFQEIVKIQILEGRNSKLNTDILTSRKCSQGDFSLVSTKSSSQIRKIEEVFIIFRLWVLDTKKYLLNLAKV